MATPIEEIEGIGPAFGEKLRAAGCDTVEGLLNDCKTKKGRADVAAKTGLSEKQILDWVNMADLFRIKGVASQFAELLEASGVDTVKELCQRNAENLAAKMKEVNDEKKLAKTSPSASTVEKWIEEAKTLPPMVEY